jgi:chromosome partitioning protein
MSYMRRVQQRANPKLKMLGIVINRFNARRKLEVLYYRILHENFAVRLFGTVFRDHVPYVEAVTSKLPITSYQPGSPQAQACREFAKAVIARGQEQND